MGLVHIFVGKVDAAGIGHPTVDDGDLPVVTIVVVGRDKGAHPGENAALDAQCFQIVGEGVGQLGKLAGAVVQQAHLHALPDFFGQNVFHLVPHPAVFHDEIFQKDKLPCLLQIGKKGGKEFLTQRIIVGKGTVVGRKAACRPQIMGQACIGGMFPGQLQIGLGGGQGTLGGLVDVPHPVAKRPVTQIGMNVNVQRNACGRRYHNQQQPGDFGIGVGVSVQDIHHRAQRQQGEQTVIMRQIVAEAQGEQQHQSQLQQYQQCHNAGAAEHQMEQTLFTPLQKIAAFFDMHFFVGDHGGLLSNQTPLPDCRWGHLSGRTDGRYRPCRRWSVSDSKDKHRRLPPSPGHG